MYNFSTKQLGFVHDRQLTISQVSIPDEKKDRKKRKRVRETCKSVIVVQNCKPRFKLSKSVIIFREHFYLQNGF